MIEKLKTAVLTLLVFFSLLQSYLLSYSYPKLDPVTPQNYVKTDLPGVQASLEDMLFPDQLVLHLGNQQHRVHYPNTRLYNDILDNVRQRYLEGIHKVNTSSLGINWDDVKNKQQGVELRFRDGLPMNVLGRILQLKGDLPSENDLIVRVWIFAKDLNEVRAILFTDSPGTAYEANKADFTAKDIERFIIGSEHLIPYKATANDNYVPVQPLTITGYTMGYTQFTVEQMKQTFFVDPTLTRNLTERDGSEIYTDGKRGLQLKKEQHWMTYSDPVALGDSKMDVRENLLSAVQFINQHGGWNGTYAVQKVPQRQSPGNQAFIFRQYYGSFPVINAGNANIGFMKIVLQKGIVSGYERSMMIPDSRNVNTKDFQLPGGEDLEKKLNQFASKDPVVDLFPAYKPVVSEKTLELVPTWALMLRDGSYEFLE